MVLSNLTEVETPNEAGVYLYHYQESYFDERLLVIITGELPFLEIKEVFNVRSNEVVGKDELKRYKYKVYRVNF